MVVESLVGFKITFLVGVWLVVFDHVLRYAVVGFVTGLSDKAKGGL